VLAPLARLLEVQPYPVSAGTALAGKTVVVTGTLSAYTRDSIKAAILSAGGSISDSVSRKTSYLIVGADAGSKLVKAQALGVELLTEQQFSDMITS
jgi:DNA ligase (NAD+)